MKYSSANSLWNWLFSYKLNAIKIPVPDQILIYKNGVAYEVNPDSKEFSDVYSWCNEVQRQNTMESAKVLRK